MSKKFMPDAPVPPWRVGVWVSSADPRKHVVMVAVGDEEIAEYGAHRDFVRWLTPDPGGAGGVPAGPGVQRVAHSLAVSIGMGHGLTQEQAEEIAAAIAGVGIPLKDQK